MGPRRPPYSVSKVEGSACSFSSFVCPKPVAGFALVAPFRKEFRLGIFSFTFRGILGSPHGFKHKNPKIVSIYLVGPRRPPYLVSKVKRSGRSFSSFFFPNLVVGFALVAPFRKEFRLGIFTFTFRGILGSPHGFKHKNPTLAAVQLVGPRRPPYSVSRA